MLIRNNKALRQLVSGVLAGQESQDVTLMIKGAGYIQEESSSEGLPFERRRTIVQKEAVVQSPEERLIRPISRSPRDLWTIVYRNEVVAKGRFNEVEKALTEIPRQLLSRSRLIARQVFLWLGVGAVAGLLFLAGVHMGKGSRVPIAALTEKLAPIDYRDNFAQLTALVSKVLNRQEVLKTILVTQPQKEQVVQTDLQETFEDRVQRDFTRRLHQLREDNYLHQLSALEQRRANLMLQDRELDMKGFTPYHWERRSLAASLQAVNQQIRQMQQSQTVTE